MSVPIIVRFHPILLVFYPTNTALHLVVSVDPEPFILGDARELDVVRVELLLHDLLEGLEHELFGLGQGEGFVVGGLQFGLGAFGAGADGFGVVAVEGA